MNFTQIQTILAPFVAVIAAWLTKKIPFIDAAAWNDIINAFFTFVTAGFMGWINRGKAIITQAANLPEVKTVVLEPTAPSTLVTDTPTNVTK